MLQQSRTILGPNGQHGTQQIQALQVTKTETEMGLRGFDGCSNGLAWAVTTAKICQNDK